MFLWGGCIIILVMSSVITKLPKLIKFGQFLFMHELLRVWKGRVVTVQS